MSTTSKIEWTQKTWPPETPVEFTEGNGRTRRRTYVRVRTDRPGARERRERAVDGPAWCRGHRAWLPLAGIRKGVCRPCANAEYRATYAEDGEAIRQRVYARKRDLEPIPGWWAVQRREEFGGLCAYGCGRAGATFDHLFPVVRGGQSRPDNLVPACAPCNCSKRDGDPMPWLDRFAQAFPAQWADFIDLNYVHAGYFDAEQEVV